MKIGSKIVLIVLIAMQWQACKKKDIPEANNGNPVFMIDATINGNAVSMAAGKNQYYMFTSYQMDALGLNLFMGNLRSENCEKCNHEFSIVCRDSRFRNSILVSNMEDVLKTGNYSFHNGTDTSNLNLTGGIFNFYAFNPSGSNYTFNWTFGDGATSTLANPVHQYAEPADYNVCLTVSKAGIPSKTICNIITTDTACRFQFNQSMSQTLVSFIATGSAPSYIWDFGDSTAWQLSGANTTYIYSQPGVYRVVLRDSLSSASCSNFFQKDILVGNFSGNELAAGFNYTYSIVPPSTIPIDSGFRKIIVNYTAPDGKQYSTYNPYKPHVQTGNSFVISNSEPYQKNSDGQKTYKIEGSFKAWFYNISNNNDSIFIDASKYTLGVAYP